MQWFLKILSMLWLLITICVSIAIFGNTHNFVNPITQHIPELNICSGNYCLFGIILGQTTWTDAKQKLPQHETTLPDFVQVVSVPDYRIFNTNDYDQNRTHGIIQVATRSGLTLGDIVSYFGAP